MCYQLSMAIFFTKTISVDEALKLWADPKRIPIEEQANVPGGLLSLEPGTVPGKRPPSFGKRDYSRLKGLNED